MQRENRGDRKAKPNKREALRAGVQNFEPLHATTLITNAARSKCMSAAAIGAMRM